MPGSPLPLYSGGRGAGGEGESVRAKSVVPPWGEDPLTPGPSPPEYRGRGEKCASPIAAIRSTHCGSGDRVDASCSPQRFTYARLDYAIIRCQGPERIETGWWRCDDIRRDYYMVETSEGNALVVIFQRVDDGHWFLHGCFD